MSSVPQYIYHWFLKTLLYPSWNESLLIYLRQYTILFQRETLLCKYLLCNVTDTQLIKNKILSNFWAWYWEFNVLTNIDRLTLSLTLNKLVEVYLLGIFLGCPRIANHHGGRLLSLLQYFLVVSHVLTMSSRLVWLPSRVFLPFFSDICLNIIVCTSIATAQQFSLH